MSDVDVLVYGDSAAALLAAVAARGLGATVALVGAGEHLGGMVASGLGWTDIGRAGVVGGLTRAFYARVGAHYGVGAFGVVGPEPHVAEAIFAAMLAESGAEYLPDAPLESLEARPGHLVALHAGGRRLAAGCFVDASYEGDLMAAAGVTYRIGREPQELHGETWAGRQPAYRPGMHNFPRGISPFRDPSDPTSGLVPLIAPTPLDADGWPSERLGQGDGALQAYQLRLCLTDRVANQLPYVPPDHYDPERFVLARRYLELVGESIRPDRLLGLVADLLPNHKCDVNSIGPLSLNLLDGTNLAWVRASAPERAEIWRAHRDYSHELLHFLRTEAAVPETVREEVARFWLCADEFDATGGWPHQLYVRDARRMVGEVILTERDLRHPNAVPDAVATGSYNIDLREIERTWRFLPEYVAEASVFNEGYLSLAVPDYPIPYRCLLPKRHEADNLLVPVCCSASHLAYGSLRTEPTLMALGEAAGAAAALSAIGGTAAHDVATDRLAGRLGA